jgi:hypothetical protein
MRRLETIDQFSITPFLSHDVITQPYQILPDYNVSQIIMTNSLVQEKTERNLDTSQIVLSPFIFMTCLFFFLKLQCKYSLSDRMG